MTQATVISGLLNALTQELEEAEVDLVNVERICSCLHHLQAANFFSMASGLPDRIGPHLMQAITYAIQQASREGAS